MSHVKIDEDGQPWIPIGLLMQVIQGVKNAFVGSELHGTEQGDGVELGINFVEQALVATLDQIYKMAVEEADLDELVEEGVGEIYEQLKQARGDA